MGFILLAASVMAATLAVAVVFERRGGLEGLDRRRKAARRVLMQVPGKAVVAVKDGERVRLTGRALARDPLRTSPISQRGCIGFRLTADRGGAGVWERVLEQEELGEFVLTDGTGDAILHAPFRFELDPYDARSENVPQALLDLLKQAGVDVTKFGSTENVRYVETLLVPGDEIIAVGRATLEIDPAGRAPGHRQPPVTCHLRGSAEPVVIADA